MMASKLPAAPSVCPIAPLIEFTGIWVAAFTEERHDRGCFHRIIEYRAGAVGTHEVHRLRRQPRVRQRHAHGPGGTGPIARWCGHMGRVRCETRADDFDVNPSAARARMLAFLYDQNRSPFSE